MEKYLKEVIGIYLILISPPPIPVFIRKLLMKPMFGIFTIEIKFNAYFWVFFKVFIDL